MIPLELRGPKGSANSGKTLTWGVFLLQDGFQDEFKENPSWANSKRSSRGGGGPAVSPYKNTPRFNDPVTIHPWKFLTGMLSHSINNLRQYTSEPVVHKLHPNLLIFFLIPFAKICTRWQMPVELKCSFLLSKSFQFRNT